MYDMVFITESWLTNAVPDSLLLNGSKYNVLRFGRKFSTGGGVCAFIKSSIYISQVSIPSEYSTVEIVAFDLLGFEFKYRIITIYIPPYKGKESHGTLSLAVNCLVYLFNCELSVILLGDMNLPGIDWSNPFMKTSSRFGYDFKNFFVQNALVQQVSFPTRLNNVLDLININDLFIVHSVTDPPPFSTDDHCTTNFKIFAASCIDDSEPVF